ncbi:uncharacterized protein BT62DRAFT_259832 [Guyanagaster necrorhizus]|uniref:Uncharacterized protein n=1 Tax=Guyanagaster necrorhizus TaxID=856835 RepID=A0A9P7VPB9_9AGAR|nr:uncharacterized protein BT62DRAFT_259832 [Guyanagaster necrorhizus MCA 3950]KAG7444218.1 hypothetical protein BT62DRAFT_259832 [Guyanagaster necrorhizus MCA 3950]
MLKALQPEILFDEPTIVKTEVVKSPTTEQTPPSPLETSSTAKSESSDPSKESEVSDVVRELLESLPSRNHGVGTYSVLRVVASLCADAKLDRLDADSEHPIAELNTRFVQSITEKFSAKDILEDVVANATYTGGIYGSEKEECR